jgi:hypothetical protein
MRAIYSVAAAVLLCVGLTAPSTAGTSLDHGPAASDRAVPSLGAETSSRAAARMRLHAAIRALPVHRERRAGYDRDKFDAWVDADGDCRDTRAEVLVQESRSPVTGDCTIETGRWYSYYDAASWTDASDVDIDHLVPLAEAWDSGARTWTANTRERYANDLGDRRTLVAVTDNVNQSKGDQDFSEWRPDHGRCRYLREWAAVKTRWSLTVDRAEKRAMRTLGAQCPNRLIRVQVAVVRHRPGATGRARLAGRAASPGPSNFGSP